MPCSLAGAISRRESSHDGDQRHSNAKPDDFSLVLDGPLRIFVIVLFAWFPSCSCRLGGGASQALRAMNLRQRAAAFLIAALFSVGASAQTVVYPAKGQSTDQQKKDEGECHTWAVGHSWSRR